MDILPYEAAKVDARAEGAKIASHICRATRVEGLSFDFDDRHRGLRRNAGNATPHELVEHDIADDKEAAR
jgi:hypothetical protein